MRILESLIRTLSPSCCILCNEEGSLLCLECFNNNIPIRKSACFWCNSLTLDGKTCQRCRAKTSLSGAIIPFRFGDEISQLIYKLKYDGNRDVARLFANQMKDYVPLERFDVVTFVPTTGVSQRRRGYNQAQIIAQELTKQTGLELQNLLLRNQHIDQIGLNRSGRLAAVEGNFIPTSRSAMGLRILIVDDVITTGATINECAKALKANGAKSVWALAIAKK